VSVKVQITIGKILGLLVALGYAVAMAVHEGGITLQLFKFCVVLLFPLTLIWFPDELGSLTGYIGHSGHIDTGTPPILVSIMGWLFLVGLPVLMYVLDK